MLKNTGKAAVVAGASLAVLGVAGAAYAASLTMSSDSLGAGTTAVAPCAEGTAIKATWSPSTGTGGGFTDTVNGFMVNTVTLTNVPASCTGKTVFVSVHDGTAVLGGGTFAIPSASTTVSAPVALTPKAGSSGIAAKDLKGINILIPN